MPAQKIDFQVLATTLMGSVNESVTGFLKTKADKDPTIITKKFFAEDKINISTYAEFIDGSYFSVIYIFHNQKDREAKRYCGMFILYVNTSAINFLIKVFGYKTVKDAGEEMASDAVGELCNNIAGIFKKDLSGLGYPELEISPPLKFKGFSGPLDYPKGPKELQRLTAYVWGQTIVLDVLLAI